MLYRVRQFIQALLAGAKHIDYYWVSEVLPPNLYKLYLEMPRYEQVHSYRVAQDIARSSNDPYLLQAALLHDVGKVYGKHHMSMLGRCLAVILDKFSPRLLRCLAREHYPFWSFYLYIHHPKIGADKILRAGGDQQVAYIIRNHHTRTHDTAISLLHKVDSSR